MRLNRVRLFLGAITVWDAISNGGSMTSDGKVGMTVPIERHDFRLIVIEKNQSKGNQEGWVEFMQNDHAKEFHRRTYSRPLFRRVMNPES